MNSMLRTLSLLLVSILISGTAMAQDGYNKTDEQGRKQGSWKKKNDGILLYEGQFRDDIPYGTFTYYYPEGTVKAVSVFSEQGRVTRTKLFHTNAVLMAEGKYTEKEKDSVWLYYNDKSELVSREEYKMGTPHGKWVTYYPGGQASEEIPYVNGKREGVWMQYYPDGTVKARASYIDDKLEGLAMFYFVSGKVMMSGTYVNSLKEGTWITFKEDGLTQIQEEYNKGYLVSTKEVEGENRIKVLREDEEGNQYMPGRKPRYELEDPE